MALSRSFDRSKLSTVNDFSPIAERVKPHMKSPIKFERQKARPDISPINAHESRFTKFNDNPSIYSKFRKIVSPSFSRTTGRKSTFQDISQITEYDPKIDFVRDRAGSGSPMWKTKQGRKSALAEISDTTYSVKYQSIDARVPAPNFERTVSRPHSTVGHLPSFMVNVNTRQAMKLINDKSLQMNKYAELKFYLPDSSFKLKQTVLSSKRKKRTRSMHSS